MNKIEMYIKIIENYTKEEQVMQSIEEMAELTKELIKNINRGKENREDIKSEIADVFIMLNQLVAYYHFRDEDIEKEEIKKLRRQVKRIEKGEIENE